jgi:hypothetical protein
VLGSNFRDDKRQGEAEKGIEITSREDTGHQRPASGTDADGLGGIAATIAATQRRAGPRCRRPHNIAWNPGQELTLVSGLMLASVRAHAQYWGANPHAESALGYFVTEQFTHQPALR